MLTIDFRYFSLADGQTVLDLGCGEGRHAIHIALEAQVTSVGVDLSETDLRTAHERFSPFAHIGEPLPAFYLQVADGSALPFSDNSFDRVVCSEVLEHVQDYEALLTEMRRVLKPDGILAISVPRRWPERICWWLSDEYHQVEGGHIRIFNAAQLKKQISLQGFRYFKKHWAHALHSPYWWLRCLFWKNQESSRLVRLYHRLLVWDLMQKPLLTRVLEKCLNPLIGKSVVMYFRAQPKEQ